MFDNFEGERTLPLFAGKYMGWVWLDPVMGIVGALVITRWAYGLMRDTSAILLDRDKEKETSELIFSLIEADADNRISDLHLKGSPLVTDH